MIRPTAPRGKTMAKENGRPVNYFLLFLGLLGGILAVLFYKSFLPHEILFANDSPLGALAAECNSLPSRFFGTWRNITWIGVEGPSAAPTVTAILGTIFPPALWLKIYGPFTLFFVGFSAWVFFRQLEFSPLVCLLGGLAAGLNMHFFSTACWGLGTWNIAAGMVFLALAALYSRSIKYLWARALLAGLAVGMNLMEGFDVGAIMSIFIGVFIVFRAFSEESGLAKKAISALVTEAFVVVFAAFIAALTIHTLVGTQIEGVVGTQQDVETKDKRWNFATQWSLPKEETLRLVSPGIFGYLLSQNIISEDKSAAYWGLVGQDPRIPQLKSDDPMVRSNVLATVVEVGPLWPKEQEGIYSPDRNTREKAADDIILRLGYIQRHSGTGEYAGILVALLAIFAIGSSCRGPNASFSRAERRAVWFWTGAVVFSLLAAWGRHGFLYAFLYRLPYFSTIRNPIKFLQAFHIGWIILAGYGLEVMSRRYLQTPVKRTGSLLEHVKKWWPSAAGFEKYWVMGCGVAMVLAVGGTVALFCSQTNLADHFLANGFKAIWVTKMATFSAVEAAWSVGFLAVSAGVLIGVISGAWGGPRSSWAWVFMGGIMILDLGRSDVPWIHYFNYQDKYASNTVTDFLTEKNPWEQRVMGRLSPRRAGSSNGPGFGQMYNFWMQNDFPYHNIQCLDFAEMPRMPAMDDAYMENFELHGDDVRTADLRPSARLWELTGTRYLLLDAAGTALLNEHGDPIQHGFRLLQTLEMERKPQVSTIEDAGDLTVVRSPKGGAGLIEYTHVLPRAKLFAHWETPTNGEATLATLLSSNFVPQKTVLLWTNTPVAQSTGDPNADAGTVQITDYHPKDIKMDADAKLPAVLLLNERFSASWHVTVDKNPATMLRCNYIMRGVFVPPGKHTVEFRYTTSLKFLYLSLAGWATGLLVAGFLVYSAKAKRVATAPPPPPPPVAPVVIEEKPKKPEPVARPAKGAKAPRS